MNAQSRPPHAVLTIGELARRVGVAVPNIRYYEEIGVLPKARRTASGQRFYDADDLERLKFIRNCRNLGFPLEQVRALLRLSESENRSCNEARDLAAEQLRLVEVRIKDLQALALDLRGQIAECEGSCLNGPAADCSILANVASKTAPCCGPPPLVFPDRPEPARHSVREG